MGHWGGGQLAFGSAWAWAWAWAQAPLCMESDMLTCSRAALRHLHALVHCPTLPLPDHPTHSQRHYGALPSCPSKQPTPGLEHRPSLACAGLYPYPAAHLDRLHLCMAPCVDGWVNDLMRLLRLNNHGLLAVALLPYCSVALWRCRTSPRFCSDICSSISCRKTSLGHRHCYRYPTLGLHHGLHLRLLAPPALLSPLHFR